MGDFLCTCWLSSRFFGLVFLFYVRAAGFYPFLYVSLVIPAQRPETIPPSTPRAIVPAIYISVHTMDHVALAVNFRRAMLSEDSFLETLLT